MNPDIRTLRVCALYPSTMNIYADRGNIIFLRKRCEARGIEFKLTAVETGDDLDPDDHDLFYIGGGQDNDQKLIANDLTDTKQAGLSAAATAGKVILGVCGGYQLLGRSYRIGSEQLPGLGLIDLTTVREPGPRLIGNVAIEIEIDGRHRVLAGFENHGGRTYLANNERPLGRVLEGLATTVKMVSKEFVATMYSALTFTDHCCRRTFGSPIT